MNPREKNRLCEKFGIKAIGHGMYAEGFLDGLKKAEGFYEQKSKDEELQHREDMSRMEER